MKRSVERYIEIAVVSVVLMFGTGCPQKEDVPGGAPDLIIQSITVTNQSAHVGETIRFIDVTKNLTNMVTGNFYNGIYLCTSSNNISGACYWTNHFITVGLGLGAGATKTWTGQLKIASVTAGTYYICDVADGSNNVVEVSEANNTNSVRITILNP